MRSQTRRTGYLSADEAFNVALVRKNENEKNYLSNNVVNVAFINLSAEEKRREAKKPLYLFRYE